MIIEPFIYYVTTGLVGSLFLFGVFGPLYRPKTQVEVLEEENETLRQKYKHVHGQNRLTQDEASYLQSQLGEAQEIAKKLHLSEVELKEQVVRLKKMLRSKDFEIMDLRSKLKSRRKK